ncbi:MAG: hypothetical protein IPL51_08535 [Candidatus Competibacteraceae bacterium]|nr:hypothetical protein [Candidatus Competibacteraceae bacterium]
MNIFIITAPYQVLNAIEARNYFSLSDNNLIILNIGFFQKDAFQEILDKTNWDSIKFIDFFYRFADRDFGESPPKNSYEKLIEFFMILDQIIKKQKINRLCRAYKAVDNLFLGNYLIDHDLFMRHIANNIHFNRLYLLDVGTDTLRINYQRLQENITKLAQLNIDISCKVLDSNKVSIGSFIINNFKKKLRKHLIDWNVSGVKSLTYFTCYRFEVNGSDDRITNKFEYLRSLLKNTENSGEIWFLGQPLVDQEYITSEVFMSFMKKIKLYFNNENIHYVLHPRESDKWINILKKDVNFEVKKFQNPIEYEILFSKKNPKIVVSFFTSALETCSIIYGDKVDFFAIFLPTHLLLKSKNIVEQVYNNLMLNYNNVRVISLL